eukprot:11817779-Heterocapsa_arctica.AAC.1
MPGVGAHDLRVGAGGLRRGARLPPLLHPQDLPHIWRPRQVDRPWGAGGAQVLHGPASSARHAAAP